MKKRAYVVILLIIMSLFYTGCNNTNINKNEGTENIKDQEQIINLKDYSLEYNIKTDSPVGYDNGYYMSESESGYYLSERNLITYLDKESGVYLPLCSNPDCKHDTAECVAYTYRQDVELGLNVYYYDGYVYKFGTDKSGYVNLYRISADGSGFEKYMVLFKAHNDSAENLVVPCFHRGYVYYTVGFQEIRKIWKQKLGSDEPEVIFEMTGDRQDLYRIKAYGDYVFFQAGNYVNAHVSTFDADIYAYNTITDEICTVMEDIYMNYGINENRLYYFSSSGIDAINLKDSSIENVISLNTEEYKTNPKIIFGRKFIFIDEEASPVKYLYDYSGNKICDVSIDDIRLIYGLSDNMIFGEDSKEVHAFYDVSGLEGWQFFKYETTEESSAGE